MFEPTAFIPKSSSPPVYCLCYVNGVGSGPYEPPCSCVVASIGSGVRE